MNSPATVRFNDPPVTEYNSMDVDESTVSQMSTDQLYLGPADDPESCSVSSNGPEVFSPISDPSPLAQPYHPDVPIHPDLYLGPDKDFMPEFPDKSLPAQPNQLGFPIHPDIYLGPEDDLIDCGVKQECADSDSEVSGAPVVSRASIVKSPERDLPHPDVTYEELLAMVQEFQPFESYNHTGIQSIQDWVRDYKQRHGHIPDPSIQQLLEAERPF
ncbi:uncharacterized protein EDB93DRAFT_1257507 [Suillus bovinus]|uniref:uncharacterized protein n=1 Tax=Suillus bovinus TaxID=48563 RepID=UPI001B876631|nr:uncharacterized protein EDB93DRAFT_1257507 [Suillus bovinus]KAG2126557.1 hypothetical protein EDB93DRAFT_1257507 [Suillus bovinus]